MTADISPHCDHYTNGCELEAPCCKDWFRCHHCHNDAREERCGLMSRATVARVRCVRCRHVQPSGAVSCEACSTRFAEYFCAACNLYRQVRVRAYIHIDSIILTLPRPLGPFFSLSTHSRSPRRPRQDDKSNGLYHCAPCGICRVGRGTGPGGSHWHCDGCNACLPNSLDQAAHRAVCLPGSLNGDCPICFVDMHGSRGTVLVANRARAEL
jgi:hypothetical protein